MYGVQLSQGYIQNHYEDTQSPGVRGTHLIDLGRMKGLVNLRATQQF